MVTRGISWTVISHPAQRRAASHTTVLQHNIYSFFHLCTFTSPFFWKPPKQIHH